MAKLPKMPKGLSSRLRKAETKQRQLKKIADRKKEIESKKALLNKITEANRNGRIISIPKK
jgi:hypothetical protein